MHVIIDMPHRMVHNIHHHYCCHYYFHHFVLLALFDSANQVKLELNLGGSSTLRARWSRSAIEVHLVNLSRALIVERDATNQPVVFFIVFFLLYFAWQIINISHLFLFF